MELRINSESPAARVIIAMTHAAGTAKIYLNTLSRVSNAILFNQDDLGMDDFEALDTIRALALLRADIQDIAADKTIARVFGRDGDDDADAGDGIDFIPTGPFSAELKAEASGPGDPWQKTVDALKSAVEMLHDHYKGIDIPRVVCEKFNDISIIVEHLLDIKEWDDARAENPELTGDEDSGEPYIRMILSLIRSRAVDSFAGLEKLLSAMTRQGYPAEKLAEVAEALDLQMKVIEMLERNLDGLSATEPEKPEGGATNEK